MRAETLRPLVGSLRQYGSVRRITLDDGGERGVRALAFSTGGGLDFWAMADRALDIGPLSYRGTPLAWAAPHGFRSPWLHVASEDGGYGFDRSYSGLLATAGLDHIRHPDVDRPHHGRIAMTPARITAYGEDWHREEPLLYCEGEAIQSRFGAEGLSLRRRIEAPIGGTELRIIDVVENIGAEPSPQAMLYHFNFGFPGIGNGTEVALNGQAVPPLVLFGDASPESMVDCFPAQTVSGSATCGLRIPTEDGGERTIALVFDTTSLPFVQVYRNLRRNNGLLAIEPCTSQRLHGGKSSREAMLEPGDSRHYRVRISVRGSAACGAHREQP